MKKIVQFLRDSMTVWSMERRTVKYKFSALLRMWNWHIYLKRTSFGFIGTYKELRFLYDTKSDGCALTYILENLEFPVMWWVTHCVRKDDVFIDIGSNVGNYSLLAASRKSNVFAFEPNKRVIDLQKIQILLNDLTNILLFPKAVGDKDGFCTFYLQDIGLSGISSVLPGSPNGVKEKVAMTTIDTFVRQEKLQNIQCVKIDAEGAESLIFEGMKETLKHKRVEYIIWEIANLHNEDLQKALISFDIRGYSTEVLKNQYPPTTAVTYKKENKKIKKMLREYYEDFEKGTIN